MAKKNPAVEENNMGQTLGDLERVRDILFGAQVRTTDDRLEQTQAAMRQMGDELRQQMASQSDGQSQALNELQKNLESHINQVEERLLARLTEHEHGLGELLVEIGKRLQNGHQAK